MFKKNLNKQKKSNTKNISRKSKKVKAPGDDRTTEPGVKGKAKYKR